MTTPLTKGSCLRRKVDGGRFGTLILEAEEGVVYLREPGRRTRMGPISWESLFIIAADRLAKRKPKRRPKGLKVGI